ncbi:MAG: hypothetical protein AAF766_16375 [Cyanobacteria bacterium P01_D01_bin.14]
MKIKVRQLVFRLSMWLIAEIVLSLLGLDDLADYAEYLNQPITLVLVESV